MHHTVKCFQPVIWLNELWGRVSKEVDSFLVCYIGLCKGRWVKNSKSPLFWRGKDTHGDCGTMLYKSVTLSHGNSGTKVECSSLPERILGAHSIFYRQLLCEPSLIQSYHSTVISFRGLFWGRTCRVRWTGHSNTVDKWQSWECSPLLFLP